MAGAGLARGVTTAFMLHAGTRYPHLRSSGPVLDATWLPIDQSVHDVALELRGLKALLDQLVERVAAMIRSLESGLADYSRGKTLMGSDLLAGFSIEPIPERGNDPVANE